MRWPIKLFVLLKGQCSVSSMLGGALTLWRVPDQRPWGGLAWQPGRVVHSCFLMLRPVLGREQACSGWLRRTALPGWVEVTDGEIGLRLEQA